MAVLEHHGKLGIVRSRTRSVIEASSCRASDQAVKHWA